MPDRLKLSPTTGLSLFKECPRCFWLHYNEGVKRPDTIFPSLPGGMDRIIKDYFDTFRKKDKLPPELENNVDGRLMTDQALLDNWRNWRAGLRFEDKALDAVLAGSLDDCLLDGEYYIPVDFKTRGAAPKQGQSEEYYQTQLDCYCFLLENNGYKTKGYAYLVYYFPDSINDKHLVKFDTEVVRLKTNHDRVYKVFSDAVNILKGPIPSRHTECGFCAWYNDLLDYD